MKPALKTTHSRDYSYSPDARVENTVRHIREKYPSQWPEGQGRIRELLSALGDPHKKLPPVFHAAGTNGKGSTLAFVESILNAGGKSVHKFISPHLVRFEERIVLNGSNIESGLLADMIAEVDATGVQVSFFEFITALAFLAYARHPADALLLETGLGGRDDATNVLDVVEASILTRISFDHMHVLGDTIADIATHKAGIIKQNCPVIMAAQDVDAEKIFRQMALEKNAPVVAWTADKNADGFVFNGMQLPTPALLGDHQIVNAGTAIAAVGASRFRDLLTVDILAAAMRNVRWPARLEKITSGLLYDLLPQGWELWIDGSHNDSGAETLVHQARAWGDDKPLHILTAYKRKKDISGFYAPLLGKVKTVQVVRFPIEIPMTDEDELSKNLKSMGFSASVAENTEAAIGALSFQFKTPQRILLTGSLYYAGHALRYNQ